MDYRTGTLVLLLSAVVLGGCSTPVSEARIGSTRVTGTDRTSMVASYSDGPVTVDGKLDEAVWQRAIAYPLAYAYDRGTAKVLEGGSVQLAWDDGYFYVGVEFEDSDIIAEGAADQMAHFALGDVCELFLKPREKTWYWELYATPLGFKTSYWFPGRGRFGLPSNFEYSTGLIVQATNDGTVNNWRDRDRGWTAEMAIPISDLTLDGQAFGAGVEGWTILVARYNYSRYHPFRGPELTMTPALSETNFHLIGDYAKLVLDR